MSYTYLQEQGAESWAESFSDIPAYVLSRLNLTAGKSCCNVSETESCQSSPSGTMCGRSTESPGAASLTLCAVGSRAETLAPQGQTTTRTENFLDWTAQALDCGEKWRESLAKLGQRLCLLKTPRICDLAGYLKFSTLLTKWGITRDGVAFDLAIKAQTISGKECLSLLPTPTRHNAKEGAYPAEFTRKTPTLAAQIGGKINPDWNEQRMGWPIKWTDLEPLETARMREWLNSHGKR